MYGIYIASVTGYESAGRVAIKQEVKAVEVDASAISVDHQAGTSLYTWFHLVVSWAGSRKHIDQSRKTWATISEVGPKGQTDIVRSDALISSGPGSWAAIADESPSQRGGRCMHPSKRGSGASRGSRSWIVRVYPPPVHYWAVLRQVTERLPRCVRTPYVHASACRCME